MELDGIDGVYLVSPSLDGRPVGKFVARDNFARVATNGIGLHPLAMTDFRATLWGKPIGFNEDDREGTIVPDPSTFRRLPWQPRLARVFCFYYDTDSGDLRDLDPRGTLARHEHTFVDEVGVNMMVGIEPELMWLRKKENGELEHTVEPFAFYEIAYLEEWEPILLDLIEYGRGMGLPISHADSEDKSQVEVNQLPGTPLAYVDNFYTYRQLCRIVARKHGLIATFMAKPFMGCSANGHHHSISLIDDDGENVMAGDLKGRNRLSELGAHFLGGLIDHADATTVIGAPSANSYKRFWDIGMWAPFHKSYGFDNRSCLFRSPPHVGDRGAGHGRLVQPVPHRLGLPRHRARRHPEEHRPGRPGRGEPDAGPHDPARGAHPHDAERGDRRLQGGRPHARGLPFGALRHVRRAAPGRHGPLLGARLRVGARVLPRAMAVDAHRHRTDARTTCAGEHGLVLQNDTLDPPALLGDWLDERGIPFEVARSSRTACLPTRARSTGSPRWARAIR